jgi:hypothetical protein
MTLSHALAGMPHRFVRAQHKRRLVLDDIRELSVGHAGIVSLSRNAATAAVYLYGPLLGVTLAGKQMVATNSQAS